MAGKTSTYRRLPGKKKGFFFGSHTLWLGSDHLLQVYARMGGEDYKRFYFNDIQAIITRKTGAGRIQSFILGALAGLFSLLAVASGDGWSVFHAILAGLMLFFFVLNFFKGPTCETHLLTAVQTEKLPSLHRLKSTQPVMDKLKSFIEQQQGRVPPETFTQESARLTAKRIRTISPASRKPIRRAPRHESGRVHGVLFALLIFDGLIAAGSFFFSHVGMTLLSTAVTMLMGICVVVALVKQHESDLKGSLRSMTWAALGYVCFSFVSGYVISMGLAFKHPEILRNQWELFKLFASTSPRENPLLLSVNLIAMSGAACIGIPGLFLLKSPQQPVNKASALAARTPGSKRIP